MSLLPSPLKSPLEIAFQPAPGVVTEAMLSTVPGASVELVLRNMILVAPVDWFCSRMSDAASPSKSPVAIAFQTLPADESPVSVCQLASPGWMVSGSGSVRRSGP